MADSGDEQVTDQPPTEGSEEVVDSTLADQEKSDRVDELDAEEQGWPPLDTAGDDAEEGLVEEVMKAISASSSPQPGELPEMDMKQPERDPTDSEEAPESSEGVANDGEEEKVPADAPAETESVPQPEQKAESEVQEKEVEAPAEEQKPPKEEEPPEGEETPKEEELSKEEEPPKEAEPPKEEEPPKEQEVEQEKSRGDEHEAGPHWLSAEEVRAKGIAEDCLNKYRRFHLKQAFAVNQWYELLKQCTFETEFVALSKEEVEALLASHHLTNPAISEDHKEALSALEEKLHDAISKYGEDGVFLKLNTQGTQDVFLDQSDPDHLTGVQEDIVTEVEVDRQTSNAYLIWRSWRSASFRRSETSVGIIQPTEPRQNVLRRSFRRIQRTWHHNRPSSSPPTKKSAAAETSKEPLAEDSTKPQGEEQQGEEQPKPEEGGGDQPQSTEKTDDKKGEEAAAVEVTAEVTVEADANKEAPKEEKVEADVAGQPPATDVSDEAAKAEGGDTEESATTTPKESEEKGGDKPSDAQEPALTVAEEPKEGVAEPQQGQPTAAEDTAKDKKDPSQAKPKPDHVHGWGEQGASHLKEEPMNNRVLRAFKRVVAARLRVTSGSEALNRLLRSSKVHQLLTEWEEFSAAEGGTVHIVLRRWNTQLPRYPDMLFRAFVFKNKLTALTQHDQTCFTPNIARFKSTIEKKIKMTFTDSVQGPLGDYQNYTVDFFVSPNKVLVVDIGPFQSGEHSGLFCWISHHKQLTSTPVQFKVISNARKGDIFTDLPSTWKQVCQNVTEQKVGQDSRGKKCVIL